MIHNIYIKNFILIENLSLELGQNLNVITGETGAGKSILLDAISFCLTGKFGVEIIRKETESSLVTVSFNYNSEINETLASLGVESCEDDQLIITRQISKDGKKKLLINNQHVTQKALDHISDNLVIIYGQHSFNNLFKTSSHLKILDNFIEDNSIFSEISELYKKIKNLSNNISSLQHQQKQISEEIDYLEHVSAEIKKAKITQGEELELTNLRLSLQQNQKHQQLIQDLAENFRATKTSSNISSIIRQINRSGDSNNFNQIAELLENVINNLDEVEQIFQNLLNKDAAEINLEEIEERLFMIKALARKHNMHSDNLPSYLEEIESKLSKFSSSDAEIKSYEKELKDYQNLYFIKSATLSEYRKKAAIKVEKLVTEELASLKMPGCKFKVEFTKMQESDFSEKGLDIVRFIASTNPGTPYGSIEKIASGGEMARFMLALQVALFQNNKKLPTIIFDEIDTGIGGAVANAVGTRLQKLGDNTQVIAVTHQPQVASKSSYHIKMIKDYIGMNTKTSATIISKEARIDEIARMLSGEVITETARKAALELMEAR